MIIHVNLFSIVSTRSKFSMNIGSYCHVRVFFYFLSLFIYFLAVLGLRCCTQAFSSSGEQGLLFVVVLGLLIATSSRCRARALGAWASVVVACGLSSCGSRAVECRLSSWCAGA